METFQCEKAYPTMKDFYQNIGLCDYPFNVYTAENETKYASKIFIHPQNYDAIKESFDNNRSIIMRGNRGTGKTALLSDLLQTSASSAHLTCFIDDYSEISIQPTTIDYYNLIIRKLVTSLFSRLEKSRTVQSVNTQNCNS